MSELALGIPDLDVFEDAPQRLLSRFELLLINKLSLDLTVKRLKTIRFVICLRRFHRSLSGRSRHA